MRAPLKAFNDAQDIKNCQLNISDHFSLLKLDFSSGIVTMVIYITSEADLHCICDTGHRFLIGQKWIILFRNPHFCWKPGEDGAFHRNPLKFVILRGVSAGWCTGHTIIYIGVIIWCDIGPGSKGMINTPPEVKFHIDSKSGCPTFVPCLVGPKKAAYEGSC